MEKQVGIDTICAILEIPVSSYGLSSVMQKEEAEKALQDFKDLVKKQHRILVKKYHPDLPSSGEYEEERMKEINNIIDLVMQLKITLIQRPQPVQFHFHSNMGSFYNTSTTSGTSGTFHFRYR